MKWDDVFWREVPPFNVSQFRPFLVCNEKSDVRTIEVLRDLRKTDPDLPVLVVRVQAV
jgi:hypothetical protein